MADIGIPVSFVNPNRYGRNPSSSTSRWARLAPTWATTSFSKYLRLPVELRLDIMRITIDNAVDYHKRWRRDQLSPVVIQCRRGALRVQSQHREPPSLPQLACVSKEWQAVIEKQLFEVLRLIVLPGCRSHESSDLDVFSAIVTGPRREYLARLRLDSYREHSAYPRPGSGDPEFYRTGGSYGCIVTLFQVLGSWAQEHVRNLLLRVKLNIELQDFALGHLVKEFREIPSIPFIIGLEINMDPNDFSKLPLALPDLLLKLRQLRSVDFDLSPWCSLNEDRKDHGIQSEHLHSICIQCRVPLQDLSLNGRSLQLVLIKSFSSVTKNIMSVALSMPFMYRK